MYENSYAKENSAHFLMGWEAAEWYNKNFGTTYTLGHEGDDGIIKDGEDDFLGLYRFVSAEENPVIEVLANGSYYWFTSGWSSDNLFFNDPHIYALDYEYWYNEYFAFGVRPLVTLKSEIRLESDEQTQSVWNKWEIVESAN